MANASDNANQIDDGMMTLDLKDVHFLSNSVTDDFGRVFSYEGQIYRMISPEKEPLCREMLEARFFKKLTDLGYIPKTVIEEDMTISVENHDCIILRHEKCPDTRQHEWSFEMFKAAVILLLQVKSICNEDGYDLKDYHLGNITFKGTKPVFIDIGSFVKSNGNSSAMNDEFFTACLLPLLLWKDGEYFLNRCVISDNTHYSFLIPFQQASDSAIVGKYKSRLSKTPGYYLRKTRVGFKNGLKRVANGCIDTFHIKVKKRRYKSVPVDLPSIAKISRIQRRHLLTAAESYHSNHPVPENDDRLDSIVELIHRHCADATTLTDIAGREGQFCLRLAKRMTLDRIFLIENDEDAIDKAFCYLDKNSIMNINTVFTNAMFPLYGEQDVKRLKSDLVVALAVTHHLILSQHFHVSFIFERLSMYTNRYVCVEFMPLGLSDGPVPAWYHEEWFTSHFLLHFRLIHKERIESNSILYIGEKIDIK
jgi:hypothetical protein